MFLSIFFDACSQNVNIKSEKRNKFDACSQNVNIKSEKRNINSFTNNLDKKYFELSSFEKYQTFNELKMEGMGKVALNPFVYVRKKNDTIYVIASNDTTTIKKYFLCNHKWCSYEEYELWKRNTPITKSGQENPARTYYRMFFNDSIAELRYCYMGETITNDFYLKTADQCIWITQWIPVVDNVQNKECIYDEMTHIVDLLNCKKDSVTYFIKRKGIIQPHIYYYNLKESTASYIYECVSRNEILYFNKNSLGLFGIQPGLEKYDRHRSILP